MTSQNRSTRLFVGFFLLAGLIYMFNNPDIVPGAGARTVLFCANFLIYAGLLLLWLRSVHGRLLPSRERTYMLAAVWMMLLYLMIRAFKYRIAGSAFSIRLSWYAYYLPMAVIPTLFAMVCIRIRRGEAARRWDERLLLLPAVCLAVLFLTNDLHHLVFRPNPGVMPLLGEGGTYTYGACYYVMYAWIILQTLTGIFLLVRETGKRLTIRQKAAPLAILSLWMILSAQVYLFMLYDIHPPYQMQEIYIFCMLAIFEVCIRGRLIPCNENYAGFFASLQLPVLITDNALQPVYTSAGWTRHGSDLSVSLTNAARDALANPVYVTPDEKLSGKRLHGGFSFWISDETEIHRANESLQEANELLDSENTLIAYENRQKEESAYLESRHHIYHEIADAIYPNQKRIADLLASVSPGTEDYRDKIAYISVLNAYVKRKTNLLLLAFEEKRLPLRELYLSVEESGRYLIYQGIKTAVAMNPAQRTGDALPAEYILALYDVFEQAAEQLIGHASSLMVTLREDGMTLAADADQELDLTGEKCILMQSVREDGWYLTVRIRNDGPLDRECASGGGA